MLDALALEADFARGRRDRAGEDFDQGRFAGPVFSQYGVHLAAPQIEVDVLQRGDAAIVFADAFHLQKRRLRERRDGHDVAPS